jgi:hypothetical protein
MSSASTRAVLIAAGGVLAAAVVASAEPAQLYLRQHHKVGHNGGGNIDSFPFSENFDSYTVGSFNFPCATASAGCTGPNGFGLWGVTESSTGGIPGPNNASISNAHASNGANSMLFAMPATDVVQTGNVTSGQWVLHVDTYVTSGVNTATSGSAYIIVMNTYTPPSFPSYSWSVQMGLDATTGQVMNFDNNTQIGTLIYDQWVPAEVDIDIDADTYTLKYNGAVVLGPTPYSTGFTTGGAHAIACLDFFSDDAVGVYYDNISLTAASTSHCYANCDGSTSVPFLNVNDFICFQSAFATGCSAP